MSHHHNRHHGVLETYLTLCGAIGAWLLPRLARLIWVALRGVYRLVRAGVRKAQARRARATTSTHHRGILK